MARLIFLAACFSGVLATMSGDSMMGGSMMPGDKMASEKMGGKDKMDMGGDNTKVNVEVDVAINVIQWSMGGGSAMQNVASPSMAAGTTHQVTVGGTAGKVFVPNSVMASVGDMIQFNFKSANHTLTQSTFPLPCVKMAGGKDSGFMPNANDAVNPPPMFMVQVMDTKPAWFYCKQKGHCGSGMTFSINPTANKTQDQFMQMAMQQNGTAGAGMAMASSSAAAAPPASSAMTSAMTSVMTSAASSVAAVATPAATSSMMDSGMGSMMASGGSGACSCSCLCGTAAFPAGAGIGMYGGMSGAIPMGSG